MKSNKLTIQINKPLHEVFLFTITPPNSIKWISFVVKEQTNEWPIKAGTVYTLQNKKGEVSEVTVTAIQEDKYVEWVSKDKNYHCRYTLKPIDKNTTLLVYHEWVDNGELEEPFIQNVLDKLKLILES